MLKSFLVKQQYISSNYVIRFDVIRLFLRRQRQFCFFGFRFELISGIWLKKLTVLIPSMSETHSFHNKRSHSGFKDQQRFSSSVDITTSVILLVFAMTSNVLLWYGLHKTSRPYTLICKLFIVMTFMDMLTVLLEFIDTFKPSLYFNLIFEPVVAMSVLVFTTISVLISY